ncbi:MAG: ribonucleoside triphosphate reductase [Candidatus Beckwithbacteria bacterium]|nr:ribonucleoside triphosphate reductase [Patescibacteria group bacterium]
MPRPKTKTEIKKIKKRDGRIVSFEISKIERAILLAAKAAGGKNKNRAKFLAGLVVKDLEERFNKTITPEVEQVQDLVEKILLEKGHEKTLRAHTLYRDLHTRLRDITSLVDSDELIQKYLDKASWLVKENANMTYSLQGLNNHVASIISSNFWLNKIYPRKVRKAHLYGDIHIHDLALVSAYCCGWDLKDILVKGFGGVSGKINSAPPKHFSTALGQLVNFFYTLQGEVAGAVAVASFDTYLAPFIRFDKLSYKEVKQAMQEFVYNMNVPTRVGFQTPFTNVTLDLTPSKMVGEEMVIIGGKPIKAQYKDFQKEMDMLNRAFGEVMLEGDAQGRVFTFPIPTYSVTKDFDWDNPVLEPIFEMTRKYGIPYWANYVNSDMKPEDSRSMCCRLKLDNRVLRKRGGLFAANPLTGSTGVVTINLPRIGYLAKTKKEFFQKLGKTMRICRDSLLIKRKAIEGFTEKGLYPYCSYYLADVKKRMDQYWSNHFSTIGILGMNEALENFLSKSIKDDEGKAFALEVMSFMRKRILQYQKSTGQMFNLEATPAEGTSYRFARIDKKKNPDILVANENDLDKNGVEPFYTNSTHLPVDSTDDIFEALDHQDGLQCKYNGGTVFHGFLGESLNDTVTVKKLIKKIASNYSLPYFTLTPTFSICPVHGYLKGEHKYCPKCGGKKNFCEVYSRVVGYLRPVSQWNPGKEAEFGKRKTYKAD